MKIKLILLSLFCFSICLILTVLCSCSNNVATCDYSENNISEKEIIANEQYYKLVRTENFEYEYYIYDSNKNIVEKQSNIKNPIRINLLNDNVVDVEIGWGTGIIEHHYYNVKQDAFSKKYTYVVAYSNDMIAYIDVPAEKSFENRRLIVRNAFDKTEYYKEFKIDFSKIDTPITEAYFINNDSQLQITYYSGSEKIERTETLDLY